MNWLDAVKSFGPLVIGFLKPNLIAFVTQLIEGILKAEAAGGSGSDKLQLVISSLDPAMLSQVTLADIVPAVNAVVQVSNALSKPK